jgi:hypothetical protein
MVSYACVEILPRAVVVLLCVLFVVFEENHARLIQVAKWEVPCHDTVGIYCYLCKWLTGWMNGWLTDRLAGWLIGWLTDRLADWPAGWMADWLTDCLADWLADWLAGWLAVWLASWLTDWPTDWPMDWLTDCLVLVSVGTHIIITSCRSFVTLGRLSGGPVV